MRAFKQRAIEIRKYVMATRYVADRSGIIEITVPHNAKL